MGNLTKWNQLQTSIPSGSQGFLIILTHLPSSLTIYSTRWVSLLPKFLTRPLWFFNHCRLLDSNCTEKVEAIQNVFMGTISVLHWPSASITVPPIHEWVNSSLTLVSTLSAMLKGNPYGNLLHFSLFITFIFVLSNFFECISNSSITKQ
jgi:hypothetical protein